MTVKINADTSDGLKFVSDTSGAIDLQANGSTKVHMASDGKVGIGNTSPSYKLSLQDSGNFEIHLLKTSVADAWVRNIGNMDIAAASGGATGQLITFSNGANYAALTEQGRFDGGGNFYFNSGYGSSAIAYGVRAWVNFNGSGTPAARASGGVSSIGDRGTGKFTVNLSVTTPDVNGAVVATSANNDTTSSGEKTNASAVQNSTSALFINLRDSSNNSQKDSAYVNVVYLR